MAENYSVGKMIYDPKTLELCCGTGRITIPFIQGDMRNFILNEKFDMIFVPFNSIHCLYQNKDFISTLQSIYKHLEDDGYFIIDYFNPSLEYIVENTKKSLIIADYITEDERRIKIIQTMEYQEITQLNFTDMKKEISPNTLEIIENKKKVINFIKKSILPIKEFTQIAERLECRYIEKRHLKYFLEIKDLCLTLLDSCDILLASLESSTNLFFSMQGHKMNQIIKVLTIVSTIFIPLTFIAGIYGMNFTNMPELHWKYGYYGILLIMILLFGGMLLYFKKKKWF